MINNIKLFFSIFVLLFVSCAENIQNNEGIILEKNNFSIGETIVIDTIEKEEIINSVVILNNNQIIQRYSSIDNNKFTVPRFLSNTANLSSQNITINIETNRNFYVRQLAIEPSIQIKKLCASENCVSVSGNVVEDVLNNIEIQSINASFNRIEYKVYAFNNLIVNVENEYNSITDIDNLSFVMPKIPDEYSSYIGLLEIKVYKNNVQVAENILPFRVVRPLEVKHYGKYELAETYEPVPVTGCIPGTIGNNVSYSESESETRQNSVSITLSKTWTNANSQSIDTTRSEGLNVAETENTVLTSSMSESETVSESETNNSNTSDSNDFSFSTNDGESWSWSFNEGNSDTQGTSTTSGTNAGINGSVTVGASTEGSIPLLGKASGKVEVTGGASMNWINSDTNNSSTTNSNSRGYVTAGSSSTGNQYGSAQTISQGHSLTGSYAYSSQNSSSISQGSSTYSGRVWNMSESISTGNVVTEGDTESIDETITSSSSSTTTFSYSGYIPRGKVGVFYRQTSRYTKLSEIITYDIDGFPHHTGYISMNTWAWAPELAIGTTCSDIPKPTFSEATCFIPPCGE